MKIYPTVGITFLFAGLQPLMGQTPAVSGARPMGTEFGFSIFQKRCMSCHGNADAPTRAPDPATLRALPPEKIYEALTSGVMKVQGQSLSEEEKRVVAMYMSGRPIGSALQGDARTMPNHCAANAPLSDPASGPAWNGWGVDGANTRFQGAKGAGLTAEQVPHLKLKWAFGYPTGVSAFGQPTVASGRVFVGTDVGYVYSLDAATGCIHWSFQTKGSVRNAISIGPLKGKGPRKYAIYFGDAHANVYAVDAQKGTLLWTKQVESHFTSRITGAPTLYKDRLYVPVSSSEEFSGSTLDYGCCTFRGSVVALDADTGDQIWKTYTIPEQPKPTKRNSRGTQLFAPAGASVWNSPTVDPTRHAIYFGTGDSETEPAARTSDAVMALDMNKGKMLWVYQAQANDSFLGGCSGAHRTENCPNVQGPDYDIGNSPILRALSNGSRILVAGTKDGNIFALDPDRNGALVWKMNVTGKQPATYGTIGIVWGGAADEHNAYYGLDSGGLIAVQLETGKRVWFAPLQTKYTHVSNAAAATAIPNVVFVGGTDGRLHALSTSDGSVLWDYDTVREFRTVNQVPAKGGSMGAPGPTVAGGMLFVGSGYAVISGTPGNALLAFATE